MNYNLKFKFENPPLGGTYGRKATHQNPAIFSEKYNMYIIYIYISVCMAIQANFNYIG